MRLHSNGTTVVLTKNANKNSWVLTGWINEKEATAYAIGEGHDSSDATAASPTLMRADGVDAIASSDSLAQPSPYVNHKSDETKLSQPRDDSTIYEREFSRIVKEYDKTATKGQTLEQKLSAEAKTHREDNKTWNKEFARLLREYDKSGRNIAKLEAELAMKSANYKQSLKDARARAEQDLKEQSQRYKESRRRATERRENSITRKQIKKLLTDLDQRMNRPSEGHYIPKEMRSAVADVLAAIDRTSNRKDSKVNAELLNLSKRYADLAQDKSGGAFSFDKTVSEMLNTIAGYDVPLREMNAEQLANVKLALTAMNHVIQNAVKVNASMLHGLDPKMTIYQFGAKMMQETNSLPKTMNGIAWKYLMTQARPELAFKWFGGFSKNSVWQGAYCCEKPLLRFRKRFFSCL